MLLLRPRLLGFHTVKLAPYSCRCTSCPKGNFSILKILAFGSNFPIYRLNINSRFWLFWTIWIDWFYRGQWVFVNGNAWNFLLNNFNTNSKATSCWLTHRFLWLRKINGGFESFCFWRTIGLICKNLLVDLSYMVVLLIRLLV